MFQLCCHKKNVFYPQAGIEISENTLLIFLHILVFLVGPKLKLTDLTITHLAIIHIMMLFTMGFLVSTDIWRHKVSSDFKFKVIVLLNKVLRGLSICTTCLLSVLQATSRPSSPWAAKFKLKSHPVNLLLCTLATSIETQASLWFLAEHCCFLPIIYIHRGFFFTLKTFRDVFFMGLMVLSRGYTIILLCRHKQQATQTILLLLSCFVIIYCVDFIISFSTGMTWTNDPILVCIWMLMVNGHDTVPWC
ncbi:unnamed protein product [Nyctereutes procyonoides]|uniref:Vomeronasal type-1 receptor n=1 Tax=Nyctereutes procyonoides TaxID=34880 RepID=A0A811Z848_NYCPR|nr:unnamed protein product [Nyctereutes procyonoides]